MLGHASAQMTLDVSSHLFTEDLEDLADRLDQRYGNVTPAKSADVVDLREAKEVPNG